jgi:hypothetical protein
LVSQGFFDSKRLCLGLHCPRGEKPCGINDGCKTAVSHSSFKVEDTHFDFATTLQAESLNRSKVDRWHKLPSFEIEPAIN